MKHTSQTEFISARQICDSLPFLDLASVYQMARTGEIPGAVWCETEWGETLYFKKDEVVKWYQFLREKTYAELEEDGLVTSTVDADGVRCYSLTQAGRNLVESPEWTGVDQQQGTKPSNSRSATRLSGLLHKLWKRWR